jgi:hypothetical protein
VRQRLVRLGQNCSGPTLRAGWVSDIAWMKEYIPLSYFNCLDSVSLVQPSVTDGFWAFLNLGVCGQPPSALCLAPSAPSFFFPHLPSTLFQSLVMAILYDNLFNLECDEKWLAGAWKGYGALRRGLKGIYLSMGCHVVIIAN